MTGRDAQECPYSNPPCLCSGPTVTGQSRPPTEGPRPPSFSLPHVRPVSERLATPRGGKCVRNAPPWALRGGPRRSQSKKWPRRFCWADSLQSATLFPACFPFPKGSATVFSSSIEKGPCVFALGHWDQAWRCGWRTVLPSFWPLPTRQTYA